MDKDKNTDGETTTTADAGFEHLFTAGGRRLCMSTETGEESEDATPSTDDEAEPASSATETDEVEDDTSAGLSQHMRAVVVTTGATLFGVLAAALSMVIATDGGDPDNLLGFAILMAAVFVQFPLYRVIGIESDQLQTKDQIYIFAMTFVMWFIIWTIFLTTGALQ